MKEIDGPQMAGFTDDGREYTYQSVTLKASSMAEMADQGADLMSNMAAGDMIVWKTRPFMDWGRDTAAGLTMSVAYAVVGAKEDDDDVHAGDKPTRHANRHKAAK